jgi:hypothetical protein
MTRETLPNFVGLASCGLTGTRLRQGYGGQASAPYLRHSLQKGRANRLGEPLIRVVRTAKPRADLIKVRNLLG